MLRPALVLGLDGATFSVLRPLAAAGQLPNLARWMGEGAHAPLASTPWAAVGTAPTGSDDIKAWRSGVRQLHAFHAAGNVALTALAVAAHREGHGDWPATLADVADLPREQALDPLTGAPLAYRLTSTGARIGPAAWGERVEIPADLDASPFVWTLIGVER